MAPSIFSGSCCGVASATTKANSGTQLSIFDASAGHKQYLVLFAVSALNKGKNALCCLFIRILAGDVEYSVLGFDIVVTLPGILICIEKCTKQKGGFINITFPRRQYHMKQNRLYWDRLAENYCERVISPFYDGETAELFYRAVKLLHADFLPAGKRNQKDCAVLDVGCGKGLFFYSLRRGWGDIPFDRHVTGIDFSPEMIRYAKENQMGGSLVKGDNTLLPLKSSGFDEVYSINSFLVPERENRLNCFAESFRVLKPHGVFTGLFPSNENHLEQAYAMKEYFLKTQKYIDEDEALHAVYQELTLRGSIRLEGLYKPKTGRCGRSFIPSMNLKIYWKRQASRLERSYLFFTLLR